MFLGLEALDEEGLKAFRKRTTPAVNNKALEVARSIGLSVAINIIADPQHAVLPTRLPLRRFYEELVKTQAVLARKHLGAAALAKTSGIVARQLLRGRLYVHMPPRRRP